MCVCRYRRTTRRHNNRARTVVFVANENWRRTATRHVHFNRNDRDYRADPRPVWTHAFGFAKRRQRGVVVFYTRTHARTRTRTVVVENGQLLTVSGLERGRARETSARQIVSRGFVDTELPPTNPCRTVPFSVDRHSQNRNDSCDSSTNRPDRCMWWNITVSFSNSSVRATTDDFQTMFEYVYIYENQRIIRDDNGDGQINGSKWTQTSP